MRNRNSTNLFVIVSSKSDGLPKQTAMTQESDDWGRKIPIQGRPEGTGAIAQPEELNSRDPGNRAADLRRTKNTLLGYG
jgi:hypothetical protein